jgi:two-component system chemotaxis response regulator CheB
MAVRAPVRVVVVAATSVRRAQLLTTLEAHGHVVPATALDADTALRALTDLDPEVLVVDLPLRAGGLDVVERVMAEHPLPVLLTGAAAADPGQGLAAGAADVLAAGAGPSLAMDDGGLLAARVSVLRGVPVITHPRRRLHPRGFPASVPVEGAGRLPLVVVGASTGGPTALATVLAGLPPDLSAAVVVVQHLADGFVGGLARMLDDSCALRVSTAAAGQRLRPGEVVLAPDGANLLLDRGPTVVLRAPRPGQLHVPGIDVTFTSAGDLCGPRAVGVLLTGMGRDGAAGMRALRDGGATTLAQDEGSSAVWGMPAAAVSLDAVDALLPLDRMAAAVVAAVGALGSSEAEVDDLRLAGGL